MLLPAAGVQAYLWRRGDPLPVPGFQSDVYWLTVRDNALTAVAAMLPRDSVVLHASGALGANVLAHPLGGVLHPLMTFPGPEVGLPSLEGVGARIDGCPEARSAARELANALGMMPVEGIDSVAWHAAASMVSGHLAALYLDAAAVLERAGAGNARELLLPLALESLRRAASVGPAAITGPAARGDEGTIALHRGLLGTEREAYDALDARIRAWGRRPSD